MDAMPFLINRIEKPGGVDRRTPEDSRKGFSKKPADDERAGCIDNILEACACSEEAEIEQKDCELDSGDAERIVNLVCADKTSVLTEEH